MEKNKLKYYLRETLSTLLPILAALVVGGFVILAVGEDPLNTYKVLLQKSLLNYSGLMKTLHYAAPLILTGLAIAISFKANIYNMAVEGAAILGGFTAAVVGFSVHGVSAPVHIFLCLFTAIAAGVLYTAVPALLKAYLDVDEMVVTLMLNYALAIVLQFFAEGIFKDPKSGYVSTYSVSSDAMFQKIFHSELTPFFFLSIAIFIYFFFVFKKSKLGFEITAMGNNSVFAESTGMNVRRKILLIMLISGALSGLAGGGFMLSEKYRYTLDFSGDPGLGWEGMLIALVGRKDPVGILIATIFFAALNTGSDYVDMFTNVPKSIVSVLQGIIILFVSFRAADAKFGIIEKIRNKFKRNRGNRPVEGKAA